MALQSELETTMSRYNEIIGDLTQNFLLQNDYMSIIPEVRCSAHTLQLTIEDSIKLSRAHKILEKVHGMRKHLRSQIINIEFRILSPKTIIPPLDIATLSSPIHFRFGYHSNLHPFRCFSQVFLIILLPLSV